MTEALGPSEDEVVRPPVAGTSVVVSPEEIIERNRIAFRDSPVGILITSFEHGRYIEANAAQCAFLGYTRDEILDADPYALWVKVTHPDDFDAERLMLQRVVDGEIDHYKHRKRYFRKDGTIAHAELTVTVVRDERQRIRYVVTQTLDRSREVEALERQRDLEARLHQSQKLETIGRLVGGVAHDFNNRLLVIMGHAELMKRAAAKNPDLEPHADMVLLSARRAADLTRQLLAYGRLQVLAPKSLDLNRIVDGLRRMLERLIGEQIELVTVLGAKAPTYADAGQLEQVLLNLVLNARDAMPAGGRVTIETADVEVTPEHAIETLALGTYVSLSVTDTGTGIPEAARSRLFEPFFTTKEVGKGTGLGLATVDGIVRQSGGAIAYKTTEGRGTTFTVYLPLARELPVEAAPPSESTPAANLGRHETVLVVDDEDEVRRLLVDVLKIGAYHVLEARDGEHALEVTRAHAGPLDLVVTDMVMPNLGGTELSDQLRELHPDVQVLFMSGYSDKARTRELRPGEHFIAKPFLPADLFVVVNKLLAKAAKQKRIERAG
jgi:two-component system, cell cycle sensor histidine kinase and response regulator CckA